MTLTGVLAKELTWQDWRLDDGNSDKAGLLLLSKFDRVAILVTDPVYALNNCIVNSPGPVSVYLVLYRYKTGFWFMANKEFRMEKRLGTSVCADSLKYALKNQYVKFLYEKTTQRIFFG